MKNNPVVMSRIFFEKSWLPDLDRFIIFYESQALTVKVLLVKVSLQNFPQPSIICTMRSFAWTEKTLFTLY